MEDVNERVTKADSRRWCGSQMAYEKGTNVQMHCKASAHTCTWGHVPCKIGRLKGEARTATESPFNALHLSMS